MIWMIENFEGTLEEICLPALLEQAAPENKTKKKQFFPSIVKCLCPINQLYPTLHIFNQTF